MYVRVVRFTDVSPERVQELRARVEQDGGPPPGAPVREVQVLLDAEQGTAVVLQHFDSEDDLRAGEQVFAAMDASETPGTRVSVDRCEIAIDLRM